MISLKRSSLTVFAALVAESHLNWRSFFSGHFLRWRSTSRANTFTSHRATLPFLSRFSYEKRLKNGSVALCEVKVFALEVERQRRKWPEKKERQFKWLSATRAAKTVKDERLSEIILRVAGMS